MNNSLVTLIAAGSSVAYALISAFSLLLLSRQIRDARRFGAAPALYALLKELDEQLTEVRQLDGKILSEPGVRETIGRCLDFFERIEHLRSAGVVPENVLRRAFGFALENQLADPRFREVIREAEREHREVLVLAKRIVERQSEDVHSGRLGGAI